MERLSFALVLFLFGLSPCLHAKEPLNEDEAFEAAGRLYQDARQDKLGAIEAFKRFADEFPSSRRGADAHFLIGESHFERAQRALESDPAFIRDGLAAKIPSGALREMEQAEKAYRSALKKADDQGLKSSVMYRLGEIAYNRRDWKEAVKAFASIESSWPKSYLLPESLLGLAYGHLMLDDFTKAEESMARLTRNFPQHLKNPQAQFVQGVLALRKGDYAQADKLLEPLPAPEARFYLAKTYLNSGKALLAATILNRLLKEEIASDLKEAAAFFIGDAFFLSKDYDGAIVKYKDLLRLHPFSKYKVAALYRIGSAYFQKKEYGQARLSFSAMIAQSPRDFYAPLAQFFIGESHLVMNQMREALFAYGKVVTGYKDAPIHPLAQYRLAWAQQEVGDHAQAVETLKSFVGANPGHDLAMNAYLIMGNSLARMKKHEEAMMAWQRVVDQASGTEVAEQALFLTLKLHDEAKNYGQILTSYQYIFRHLPPSQSKWRSLTYVIGAEAYLAQSKIEEAQGIYEMILKVYPKEEAAFYAQDGLAWCLTLSGRHEDAVKARERLREMMSVASSTFSFAPFNDLGLADSLYNQKAYEDAYQLYDKFSREHPESQAAEVALYRAGLSLYRMRYYSQAVEVWQKLWERPASPIVERALHQAADTLFRGGRYPEAVAAYKKIIERYPSGSQLALAHLRLAQAAFQTGKDADALKEAQFILIHLTKAPETVDALDLAEAVFDRSPAHDFGAFFRLIIEANPKGPVAAEAQFRWASRLFERKDFEAAAKGFQTFSVEYTDHQSLPKAQLLLGESQFNLKKYLEAAGAYERYTANYPDEDQVPLALFRLGSAQYSLQNFEAAAGAYQRLANDFSNSEYAKTAQFNLALAYKALGRSEEAQVAYQKYAEGATSVEDGTAALWELFGLQKEQKDYANALKTLEKIRSQAASNVEAVFESAYYTGEMHSFLGQQQQARLAWEQAASMKPSGHAYRLQSLAKLAEIYEGGAEWAKAAAAYDDLAKNAPVAGVAAAARERAQAMRKAGSAGKAPTTPLTRNGGESQSKGASGGP
ncbi:MAG: tetratricopeptide repeat protein [Elusimicrobia bacterium]|nr:tetratricopeptide repeat protein [Elusimicrobiota bacterium]